MQLVEEVAFHRLDQRLPLLLGKREPIHATHQTLADELGSVSGNGQPFAQRLCRTRAVTLAASGSNSSTAAGSGNWRELPNSDVAGSTEAM